MDEYTEYLNEVGITEEDNPDLCRELAAAMYMDGLLTKEELKTIDERLG
jgi:hypothetical protein